MENQEEKRRRERRRGKRGRGGATENTGVSTTTKVLSIGVARFPLYKYADICSSYLAESSITVRSQRQVLFNRAGHTTLDILRSLGSNSLALTSAPPRKETRPDILAGNRKCPREHGDERRP